MALNNTFNDIGYNSYATVEEIDAIINRLAPFSNVTKWTALQDEQKESVIITVSQDVNCFDFMGILNSGVTSPFNMKFPRTSLLYTNGLEVPGSQIPEFVKEYVARRSLELLDFGPTQSNNINLPNRVKRIRIEGAIDREFFSPDELNSSTVSLTDFESYRCTLSAYVTTTAGSRLSVVNLLRG